MCRDVVNGERAYCLLALFNQCKLDFPGGPVVKIPHFRYRGACSIPDQRAKIPHASQSKPKKHKTETML